MRKKNEESERVEQLDTEEKGLKHEENIVLYRNTGASEILVLEFVI